MLDRRIIILIATVLLAGFVVWVVYLLIPRATIVFAIAPTEATVKINGDARTVKNGDSIHVSPGEVSIEIYRDEFGTYTEKFSIKNGESRDVVAVLDAQTEAAQQLLQTDEAKLVKQRYASKQILEYSTEASKKYPLVDELPINDKYFSITPCDSVKYPDDKSKIAICINLYDMEAQQAAYDAITDRGYKLEDYEIIIVDSTYKPEDSDHYEAS